MSASPTTPGEEHGAPSRLGGALLLGLWFSIAAVDALGSLLLPAEWYAFREWELARTDDPEAPFRRSFRFESDRVSGDLANLARAPLWRSFKHQVFTTDARGFRNPGWAEGARARVIVLGDSQMVGSQVSDEDVFSVRLGRELDEPVYSFAGAEPVLALQHRHLKELGAEVAVLGLAVATLRGLVGPNPGEDAPSASQESESLPDSRWLRFRRLDPARRLSDQLVGQLRFSFGFRPRMVPWADRRTGMLFSGDALLAQRHPLPRWALAPLATRLTQLTRAFEHRGIRTLLLLIPDKETIYAERIPAPLRGRGDAFLPSLARLLSAASVPTVDLTPIFRRRAAAGSPELYFPDDTHWTPEAIRTAALHAAQGVRILRAGAAAAGAGSGAGAPPR